MDNAVAARCACTASDDLIRFTASSLDKHSHSLFGESILLCTKNVVFTTKN
jgi:hypothetical protein